MWKKLSPELKESRKVVRGWANVMRPIAERHPNYKSEATIFPLRCKNNLRSALGIFETSKEIRLGKKPMIYCDIDDFSRLEDSFRKQHGRVVSVNKYLRGGK